MQSAVYLPLYRHRWWIIYSIVYKSIHKHCSTCTNLHKLYKKQVSCVYALYEPSHVSHIWTHHLQSKLLHSMHVNDRVREGEGERWGRACNSASKNGGGRINYQLPFIAFCQKGRRKTTDPECFEAHIHWMVYISHACPNVWHYHSKCMQEYLWYPHTSTKSHLHVHAVEWLVHLYSSAW